MCGRLLGSIGLVAITRILLLTASVSAQENRDTLIARAENAYFEFETARAVELLETALNPEMGPRNSYWMFGVQLLAQILIEEGRDSIATAWLRWAVRLEPSLKIDTLRFLDAVNAHRAAREFVGAGSPRDTVASWNWPSAGMRDTLGAVRVETVPGVSLRVSVNDREIPAGERVALGSASYLFLAEADGYLPASITRELLPGVVTVLRFNLSPSVVATQPIIDSVIPSEVVTASVAALVRLRTYRYQTTPICGTGFILRGAGLFVTTYAAIRGADRVEVDLPEGRRVTEGVRVAAYDTSANVAVLKLGAAFEDSLVLGEPDDGQFAWALGHRNCQEPAATRVRTVDRDEVPGPLRLSDSVTVDAGAPLIDRTGAVIGLVLSSRAAVRVDRAARVVTEAERNDAEQNLLTVSQVASRERHAYGAIELTTDVMGTPARITPLEAWHWSDAERSGSLPMTFVGPMGRYAIELRPSSADPYRTNFTVNPGLLQTLRVSPPAVATPGQLAVKPGKRFPWPIALLGVAAAGGAVALLAGGGGGDGGGPGPSSPGRIIIEIPNR